MMTVVSRVSVPVVGMLFLLSGALKLADPAQFQHDLLAYDLFPWSLTWLIAAYLPCLEMALGGLLLAPPFRKVAAIQLSALIGIFIAVLAIAMATSRDITCGCYGQLFTLNPATTIVIDAALLLGLTAALPSDAPLWWRCLLILGTACGTGIAGLVFMLVLS